MTKRTLLSVSRLFFGLLTLAALGTQLTVHLQQGLDLVSFFSYFTYLSNIFAALVLLVGAGYLLTRREPTARDDIIRGSAVASIAIVGIVFSLFLRDANLGSLVPWVNIVLHYVMPVVMIADWLILPPKTRLTLRPIVLWLIYPSVYLVYVLIRGRIVGLYPYPFLNPDKVAQYGGRGGYGGMVLVPVAIPGGYGGVALFCVALLVVSIVVSGLLIVLGNRLTRVNVDRDLALAHFA